MAALTLAICKSRVGEQLEDADQHAVVAQHVFVEHTFSQRHDLVEVVPRDVVRRAVRAVGLAHFGACVDRGLLGEQQGLALHMLGACGLRAAVEDRQGEADLDTALRRPFVRAVALEAEFEPVGKARCARETELRFALLRRQPRALNIEPLRQGHALDIRQVFCARRQVGQALGQQEGGLQAPQAQRSREPLACCTLNLPGARHAECGVGVERLLAGALERAEVARLCHASRELGAGLGRTHDLLRIAHAFLSGHGLHPGLARVGAVFEHAHGHGALCGFEAQACGVTQPGHRDQARQAEMKAALDLALAAGFELAEREAGVGQARGLHEIGFTDAELVKAGLQAAVVEERDLHRRVGRERLAQQLGDTRVDAIALGVAARPDEVFVRQALLRCLLCGAEPAVGAEAGAAGERCGCGEQRWSGGPHGAAHQWRWPAAGVAGLDARGAEAGAAGGEAAGAGGAAAGVLASRAYARQPPMRSTASLASRQDSGGASLTSGLKPLKADR